MEEHLNKAVLPDVFQEGSTGGNPGASVANFIEYHNPPQEKKECEDHYQKGHEAGINANFCTHKNQSRAGKSELNVCTNCGSLVSPTPQTEWEKDFDIGLATTLENTRSLQNELPYGLVPFVKSFIKNLLEARDEETRKLIEDIPWFDTDAFDFKKKVLSALHK